MANRHDRVTHQKQREVQTFETQDDGCPISSPTDEDDFAMCPDSAVNTVKVSRGGVTGYMYKCMKHTSEYDQVIDGPGPLI